MLRVADLPTVAARVDNQQTGPKTLRHMNDRRSDGQMMAYI